MWLATFHYELADNFHLVNASFFQYICNSFRINNQPSNQRHHLLFYFIFYYLQRLTFHFSLWGWLSIHLKIMSIVCLLALACVSMCDIKILLYFSIWHNVAGSCYAPLCVDNKYGLQQSINFFYWHLIIFNIDINFTIFLCCMFPMNSTRTSKCHITFLLSMLCSTEFYLFYWFYCDDDDDVPL